MAAVRGKDTTPEKTVRSLLHNMGYRFRLHAKELPGKPDIVFRPRRRVIFVNGCFWHGHEDCKRSSIPETNVEFWREKIRKNVERDKEVRIRLGREGWEFLDIWQCQLSDLSGLTDKLENFLES